MSFHTDSPGSGVRLPLGAVRGECVPSEPQAEEEAGRPTGGGEGVLQLHGSFPLTSEGVGTRTGRFVCHVPRTG